MKTAIAFIGISIPFFLMTIWAIVDVALKDFGAVKKKVLWGVIAAIPFIGFIVYLIFGFRKGEKSETPGIL